MIDPLELINRLHAEIQECEQRAEKAEAALEHEKQVSRNMLAKYRETVALLDKAEAARDALVEALLLSA